jgi:pyruvate dehydrogenase E2 component (dihydrolipoamide acetyltransferase)
MRIEITIPRLGWNMDEGVFVEWLKAEGDAVQPGDVLFTLEGEKATQEIESLDAGTLRIAADAPQPGEKVAVGRVIGHLESAAAESSSLSPGERAGVRAEQPLAAAPPDAPARRDLSSSASAALPTISPRALRVAKELGVDWTALRGTGSGGRIRERDVLQAANSPAKNQQGAAPATAQAAPGRTPLSPLRRTLAARLSASRQACVSVTLTAAFDATGLVELRRQFQAAAPLSGRPAPSYNDMFIKLSAAALSRHPDLQAVWQDDALLRPEQTHIALAVDTPAGLVAPVIRNVASLGILQVAEQTRELVERARNQTLRPADLEGGTFTISNLGGYGIEAFTPVVNPPQSAILGIGRIGPQPVAHQGLVVVRERVTLNLTFDHRVVDGAPAARFLQELGQMLVNPAAWLVA